MAGWPENEAGLQRLLQSRGGVRIAGTSAGKRPAGSAMPGTLQAVYTQIQALAQEHGWAALDTYNAEGPDSGLLCILIRPPEHLYLTVHLPEVKPRRAGAFEQALRQLATVEVLTCTVEDMAQITARLSRPR